MPIELFSRRKKKAEAAGRGDIYIYDSLSTPFRVQVVHILDRTLQQYRPPTPQMYGGPNETLWQMIERRIAEEHGRFMLGHALDDPRVRLLDYFLGLKDTDLALDVIEMSFLHIDAYLAGEQAQFAVGLAGDAKKATDDLNYRFREHGIGYQYENKQIVRVDSQYVHAEVVKPALALLSKPGFKGPLTEFLEAHMAYREGRGEDAIVAANKAFESTMKVICDKKKWSYEKNKATAQQLIKILFDNKLVPEYLQTSYAGLRSVLEGTVPTARNRDAGHGQGAVVRQVADHLVAYVLHVTAANIVFLVESMKP